jgi:cysteine-rich repeat protein
VWLVAKKDTFAGALVLLGILIGSPSSALAGGPLVVATDGTPVGWSTAAPVPYRVDMGGLGVLSNTDVVNLFVEPAFSTWEDVPTATISFSNAGSIGLDVDETNFGDFLGPYGGNTTPLGENVIVLDEDGAIFDTLYGVGNHILGFAGLAFFSDGIVTVPIGDPVPPGSNIVEALVFLNGKYVDGVDDPYAFNPEVSQEEFATVFVHELGHFNGLDHTQIHGLQRPPDSDDPSYTTPVETMFPFILDDTQGSLERDDVVAISALYPAAGFASSTGRITGHVLTADGAPFSGANVIARNVADDSDAISYVSGATIDPEGAFTLEGLVPGQSYRVEVQEVDVFHSGGSRVGPFSPPHIVPGPPEFYNGTLESADPLVDDPNDFTTITASAGVTESGVDVTLNAQSFSVDNVPTVGPDVSFQGIAVGDFDRDGIADFVASQWGFDPGNRTSFYRGLGAGTFAAPVVMIDDFPGNSPVAAGQFNTAYDDFLDVAVASTSRAEVRVYFGDGQGGFSSGVTVLERSDLPNLSLHGLAAGKLDADTNDDLFTLVEETSGGATGYALLADGTGGFSTVHTAFASAAAYPRSSFSIAPVAGSSANDVIGLSSAAPPTLGILVGNGAGGFSAQSFDLSPLSNFVTLNGVPAFGDLDGNGTTDVAFANQSPVGGPPNYTRSFIDILLGDGSGSFTQSARYQVDESFQQGIAIVDLDDDGYPDIASVGASFARGDPGAKAHIAYGDGMGAVTAVLQVWGLAEFPLEIAAPPEGSGLGPLLVAAQGSTFGVDTAANYSILLPLDVCGNGIVEGAEACDDNNRTDDDCCSAACDVLAAPGTPCTDDGNPCTDDLCSTEGTCEHAYNTAPCDDRNLCTLTDTCLDGACIAEPSKDLRETRLRAYVHRGDADDRLVVKATTGLLTVGGDPTVGGLEIHVLDATGAPLYVSIIPPDAIVNVRNKSRRYVFRNTGSNAPQANGMAKITIRRLWRRGIVKVKAVARETDLEELAMQPSIVLTLLFGTVADESCFTMLDVPCKRNARGALCRAM